MDEMLFRGSLIDDDPLALLNQLMCWLVANPAVADPCIHGKRSTGEIEISFTLKGTTNG